MEPQLKVEFGKRGRYYRLENFKVSFLHHKNCHCDTPEL